MLPLVLVTNAFANTWAPYDGGFVSPSRDDAPIDGVVLYAANYLPEVTATDPDGVAVVLASTLVTGVGAEPRLAIHPPDGGWVPGQSYELAVSGYGYDTTAPPTELSFTAGTEVAPAPEAPLADVPAIGPWSADTNYGWGCCRPTRTVEIDVSVPSGDAWAWVEIVGAFDFGEPSQITTQEVHTHLDVAVGPGDHTLGFVQWLDDRGPQPPCWDVVAMSAAGVAGPRETSCTDEDGLVDDGESADSSAGCATTRGNTGLWFLLALLPALRRRR